MTVSTCREVRALVEQVFGPFCRANGFATVTGTGCVVTYAGMSVSLHVGYDVNREREVGVSIGPRGDSLDPFYSCFDLAEVLWALGHYELTGVAGGPVSPDALVPALQGLLELVETYCHEAIHGAPQLLKRLGEQRAIIDDRSANRPALRDASRAAFDAWRGGDYAQVVARLRPFEQQRQLMAIERAMFEAALARLSSPERIRPPTEPEPGVVGGLERDHDREAWPRRGLSSVLSRWFTAWAR